MSIRPPTFRPFTTEEAREYISKRSRDLVAIMQTPKAREAARSLFTATPEEFGLAAVKAVTRPIRVVEPLFPVKVVARELYRFTIEIYCRDGTVFDVGEPLRVISATDAIPYGEVGPNGHNWLCDAKNGLTVWATLEQCISRGVLQKADR